MVFGNDKHNILILSGLPTQHTEKIFIILLKLTSGILRNTACLIIEVRLFAGVLQLNRIRPSDKSLNCQGVGRYPDV